MLTVGIVILVVCGAALIYATLGEHIHLPGDAGRIAGPNDLAIAIADTSKPLGRLHAMRGKVERGTIAVGDTVHLTVDANGSHVLVAHNSPSGLSVHNLNTDGTLGTEVPVTCQPGREEQRALGIAVGYIWPPDARVLI